MIYFLSFLFCGLICMIGQIIYDHTSWTFGHITSLFVVWGALLESLNMYDFLIEKVGFGAQLPILSFGHSLAHGSYHGALKNGWLGLIQGIFDASASGIAFAIFMAFIIAILFRAKQ